MLNNIKSLEMEELYVPLKRWMSDKSYVQVNRILFSLKEKPENEPLKDSEVNALIVWGLTRRDKSLPPTFILLKTKLKEGNFYLGFIPYTDKLVQYI